VSRGLYLPSGRYRAKKPLGPNSLNSWQAHAYSRVSPDESKSTYSCSESEFPAYYLVMKQTLPALQRKSKVCSGMDVGLGLEELKARRTAPSWKAPGSASCRRWKVFPVRWSRLYLPLLYADVVTPISLLRLDALRGRCREICPTAGTRPQKRTQHRSLPGLSTANDAWVTFGSSTSLQADQHFLTTILQCFLLMST